MTSTQQSFLDAIARIDWHLQAGLHVEAREQFERALTTLASPEDLQRLTALADTFTKNHYVTAKARLRRLWRDSDPELRSWLDTFVTRTDPGLHRPVEDKPRWITTIPITAVDWKVRRMLATDDRRLRMRTPSAMTELAAELVWDTDEHRQALKSKRRPVARDPRVVTDYFRTRFLVDADPTNSDLTLSPTDPQASKRPAYRQAIWDRHYVCQVADQVRAERDLAGARTGKNFDSAALAIAQARTGLRVSDDAREPFQSNGNGLDYDHTTLPKLQGWVCVYCFGERACSDHFRTGTDGRRVSDDGLCQHCRDFGRPGIPGLAAGFTLADEVAAYCQYLTDHYPAAAPALLDQLRERSTRVVRGLVLAFLDQQRTGTPITQLTPVALRRDRCRLCFADDQLVDDRNLCDECRPRILTAA
ncbi:hypothetical protein [Nocardia sp. XZ_19_369]|uniref:hypothetical protein n=1 Tax=Nocardia sp. XZ_19_369 TaxID=2769487 RepID=UPI00188E6AF6|nr:hypothetical protein [Nocardia sp. XZ_19_369]